VYTYLQDAPPGQGGPPLVDADRYAALSGSFPTARTENPGDYAVLVSCGPFVRLEPGQSVQFAVAIVAVTDPDDAAADAFDARMLYRGQRLDLQANIGARGKYAQGRTGWNGHETCLEPPPGVVFDYDPHCPEKFRDDFSFVVIDPKRALPPTVSAETTY